MTPRTLSRNSSWKPEVIETTDNSAPTPSATPVTAMTEITETVALKHDEAVVPLRALASPRYQIEGRKTLLLQMMPALNLWNEIAASVEVRYDHDEA